jgi:hypothetical protein
VVPIPTFPLEFQTPEPGKYAVPETVSAVVDAYGKVFAAVAVEVIVPVMLSAPVIVDDAALTKIPLLKPMSVDVELPQVVGVNGKICASDEEDTLLLKVVQSVEVRKPLAEPLAA